MNKEFDWYEALDGALLERDEEAAGELLRSAPGWAVAAVADRLDRAVHFGHEAELVPGLRWVLAGLMDARGDAEAAPALSGVPSVWFARARRALSKPKLWGALRADTPGDSPVDQAEAALFRLLLRGLSFETVLTDLSRRGPIRELEHIARTGLISQFVFADRTKRLRRADRRVAWLSLGALAAAARGHYCCAGPMRWEVEDLLREQLGLSEEAEVPFPWPVPEV